MGSIRALGTKAEKKIKLTRLDLHFKKELKKVEVQSPIKIK